MGFDTKSDFAVNKKAKEIIYTFGNGDVSLLELKDGVVYEHFRCAKDSANNYTRIDRNITAEQFAELKAFSNGDYHKKDKQQSEYYRQTSCIHNIEETLAISIKSHEDEVIAKDEEPTPEPEDYRTIENAMEILDKLLTPIQKKRYILHYKNKKNTVEIAELEGVNQSSISRSLLSSEKKIKKFLAKPQKLCIETPKKTR